MFYATQGAESTGARLHLHGTNRLQMPLKRVILARMTMRICLTFIFFTFSVWAAVGREPETDWRDHVIPVDARSFDFQTVPKGAVPEHQFILRNPLNEPLHIGSVTSSCVCTTIEFDEEKSILKTYETVTLSARLLGNLFDGLRNSTITVSLDKPVRTEIQLHVRGEIRNDLDIKPNFIDFGNVELGKEYSRSLVITYTGSNTQWRLVNASCENQHIRAEIVGAPARVGVKEFRVNVSLDKAASNGVINSLLVLTSNDTQNRREIPIPIRARVGTVISVSPPAVSLGMLSPGERSAVRDAVLLGTQPFRITKIESDNPAVVVASKNPPDTPLRLHSLSVSYRNPTNGEGAPEDGVMRATIRVTTNVPDLVSTFYVTASIRQDGQDDTEP